MHLHFVTALSHSASWKWSSI